MQLTQLARSGERMETAFGTDDGQIVVITDVGLMSMPELPEIRPPYAGMEDREDLIIPIFAQLGIEPFRETVVPETVTFDFERIPRRRWDIGNGWYLWCGFGLRTKIWVVWPD